MYPLQSTTIEAGFVVAGPLDARRLGTKASSVRGRHDAASPGHSVRQVLRAIASDPTAALDRKRWLARVRPLVERSHAALGARFEADGLAAAFLRGRARLADGVVIGLLHLARAAVRSEDVVTAIAPVTVLAVGGYGRRELAPASDLDLLFLLDELARRHADAERLVGFVLAGLWDLGFEVGHATRTAAEALEFARINHVALASLLEARFLAGSFGAHLMLEGKIWQTAKEVGAQAVAAALAPTLPAFRGPSANDEEEPDVKRGPGGLRDIQRLLWLARLDLLARTRPRRANLRRRMTPSLRSWRMRAAFSGRSGATCTCLTAAPRTAWCTTSSSRSPGVSASAVAQTPGSPS